MTAYIIAIALISGIVVQILARHLRLPGIVLLLVCGVLLGPEGFGIIRTSELGSALLALLGYAVAVILFEGGMNLKFSRIRRESRVIRQLITVGAVVTAGSATLIAKETQAASD